MVSSRQESQPDRSDAEWRIFELRRQDLLAIGKAQKVHLTTLLIQIAVFWTWYISGATHITAQGVELSPRGVWIAVPALLTFFCLAFIGSVNAALPAYQKLRGAVEPLGLNPGINSSFIFYDFDSNKNVLDYFAFLKLSPTDNDFAKKHRFNPGYFLYPIVMLASICTTAFTWKGLQGWAAHFYVAVLTGFQLLFFGRPFYRACLRFVGRDIDG